MEQQVTEQSKRYKVIGSRPVRHDGEDKVTGRAQYGADISFKDQLWGYVVRSPHAHARIVSIDVKAALAMPGVFAAVTNADLPQLEDRMIQTPEGAENMRYMTDRFLARDKALFKGHGIVAIAAKDRFLAEEAGKKVKIKYEVLPAVVTPLEAMAQDAPALHGEIVTVTLGEKSRKRTNIVSQTRFEQGDVAAGFAAADVVVEREFDTKTVHQGYIEPHNALALYRSDGQVTVWTSTQGGFPAREAIAAVLKVPLSKVKVVPMEIGGGFGGKIPVYLEPIAVLLSRKTGRPVKMVMSRAEVFQSSGPASATHSRVKLGAKKDGTITAAEAWMAYEGGAFPGIYAAMGAMCIYGPYKLENARVDSFEVMTNTPKVAAYRAPSSPQAMFGMEAVLDELARKLGMDPFALRLKNAVEEGDRRVDGMKFPRIGLKETLRAAMNSAHYQSPRPSGPHQGRGVAAGFWFNAGMTSSATVSLNLDGTASVVTGSVDIGGQRASLAIIAAEVLGLKAEEVRPTVADTDSVGHTDVTGGSRTTYATGTAVHDAAQLVLKELHKRAAKLWDIKPEDVMYEGGVFRHKEGKPEIKPLTTRQLGEKLARTGGPVSCSASVNANRGVGAGFGAHIADVEVDPETGKVTVLRYTAVQDVGTAIHPSYVEGQMQGGVVQGIGWALNE
ncbi:MAG: xanthine dehydrogenase family protein, partial [Candidatus Lambdaproteobacteria bacterium]|nr:xanthine dehydrogenase family protein [Candidatus Lambdaproteobacteria bacterium]